MQSFLKIALGSVIFSIFFFILNDSTVSSIQLTNETCIETKESIQVVENSTNEKEINSSTLKLKPNSKLNYSLSISGIFEELKNLLLGVEEEVFYPKTIEEIRFNKKEILGESPMNQDISVMMVGECPDIEIIDLRNVAGYPQIDDLNVCGAADTLSLIIFNGDPGTIANFEFEIDLPTGITYAGWEFATNPGTSTTNTNPSPSRPQFFVSGFDGDSLIVVNIGLEASCDVDLTELLFFDYAYSFTYIDTLGAVHNCDGAVTFPQEYNSSVRRSVLNLLSPLDPPEVTITSLGDEFCQEISISQDGLSAYLDSFRFDIAGLEIGGDLLISSITANGVNNLSYTYDAATQTVSALVQGADFMTNNNPNPSDNQFNTSELIIIEVCYTLGSCPASADLPFVYSAHYGCLGETCDLSSENSFLQVRPTGSQMPLATTTLDSAPFVCGDDGEISITVTNPNIDTDQNKYTDLSIGFETCEVANMQITQVEVGGMVIPASSYGWVGDDLFVDFSAITFDPDGSGGIEDFDGDGFYDDLRGGESVSLTINIGVLCGTGSPDPASDVCPDNNCSFSQFYVEAKTNCGNTFRNFPSGLTGFDIVYGPTFVDNINAVPIPIDDPVLSGYDFGLFGDLGSASSPNPTSSSQEVEFCYDFASTNFNTCSSSEVFLSILFAGTEGYIYDMEITAAELSIDGGATYTTTANTATDVTWTAIDEGSRLLEIDLGSTAAEVCYRYTIELDSAWCPPPSFWFGAQQVIERCNDASCGPEGCELVRACKTATFYGDADHYDCPCIMTGGIRELYRKNYGYTDATKTTKVTRDMVSIDDQRRFLPCDTMVINAYHVITDEFSLSVPIQRFDLGFIGRGSGASDANSIFDSFLSFNHGYKNLLEFSVNKVGVDYSNRQIVDLSTLAECSNGAYVHDYSELPWGDGAQFGTNFLNNSSSDGNDGNMIRLYLENNCINGGEGNCLDEFLAFVNYEAGDTINFMIEVEVIKNPFREGFLKLGEPVGASSNNFVTIVGQIRFEDAAGNCSTVLGNDCGINEPWFGACPGTISSVSQVELDNCGGTVEHTFYLQNELPLDGTETWFSDEYRPVFNIYDIDDPFFTPMAYCGNAEIINYVDGVPMSIPVMPEGTDNMFCVPVSGFPDEVCAVDSGTEGTLFWNPNEAGAMSLAVGSIVLDSMKLKYDFCLLCPEEISAADYKMLFDYGYICQEGDTESYLCNGEPLCIALGEPGNSNNTRYIEQLFGEDMDSLFTTYDACGPNVTINDMRTPIQNVTSMLGTGATNLVASGNPGVSEEIQAIDICNPDPVQTAEGVAVSVTVPSSVRLEDVYADAAGTMPFPSTLVSDNGIEKTYLITLPSDMLAPSNTCVTVHVGTTLLFCPPPGALPPTICVGALSGCSPVEIRSALSGADGCGATETCYAYVSGDVGLQTEWFDMPSSIGLCDTVTLSVRVANVRDLVLLNIVPEFFIPTGTTVISGSWESAYPGGATTFGPWMSIPNPDIISGNNFSYSDDGLWNSIIDLNGLEGVSAANVTEDENKVAFRFKITADCDEFLSGSRFQTESMASDPCADGDVSSGLVDSPPLIITGAEPANNAQLLLIAEPEELNCMATVNTFGITALNTSDQPTADSVVTCLTIPAELNYVPNSIAVSLPAGFVVGSEIITTIGTVTEVCFPSPPIGPSQAMSLTFEAEVEESADCGDINILADIKSIVEDLACTTNMPSECDVFVQNSLNPSVKVTIAPPFIAEDLMVFSDCAADPSKVALYYEYTINHNGPNASNQQYDINFYKDINGNQSVDSNIDNLLGTSSGIFSVNDGSSIQISGSIDVDAADACPVIFEVVYNSTCACDREEQYFGNIGLIGLRDYDEPLTMCPGSCIDIDICGHVSVSADSIPSATGTIYALSLDWDYKNCYTLPHDTLPDGTVLKGPTAAFLSYDEMTNDSIGNPSGSDGLLFVEQTNAVSCGFAAGDAWLVASYGQPVNVSEVFIGGGRVSGWNANNIIGVHNGFSNVPMTLEYSSDGTNWLVAHTFSGPSSASVEGHLLTTPIAAQFWRLSSASTNDNWGTSEFRLEGEGIPYEGFDPVSVVGNTATICIPEGVGIDAPWEVAFNTGVGSCTNVETIEIWALEEPGIVIEGDTIACEGQCIDLEVLVPNDATAGMTVSWTPASAVEDPTAFRTEACNLTGNVTFQATVSYNEGACVEVIDFPVQFFPSSTLDVEGEDLDCYNMISPPVITADAGWDLYTWIQVLPSGAEIVAFAGPANTFVPMPGATYFVQATQAGTLCPAVSSQFSIPNNICLIDLGDLPDSGAGTTSNTDYETLLANNGPSHVLVQGLYLGTSVDDELDGQPSANALGDGADENGIVIPPGLMLNQGSSFNLPLTVTNTTGQVAYVEAWIDWNGDGDFSDPNEMVMNFDDAFSLFPSSVLINVPMNAVLNTVVGFRLRISHEDNMTPYGNFDSGEIEDYLIAIDCKQICLPGTATQD